MGWPTITPFYAALLGMIYFFLSMRTVSLRRGLHVGLGDAGDPRLIRTIRVHSNFAEYVPMTLIMVYALEMLGAFKLVIHALCVYLLVGRLLHAYGMSRIPENYRCRSGGAVLTLTSMCSTSVCLLFIYAKRLLA